MTSFTLGPHRREDQFITRVARNLASRRCPLQAQRTLRNTSRNYGNVDLTHSRTLRNGRYLRSPDGWSRREVAVRDDRPENKQGMFQMASVAEVPRVIRDPFDVFRGGTKVHRVT
jgi:hypothetical protein